jgi:hypothetical protein
MMMMIRGLQPWSLVAAGTEVVDNKRANADCNYWQSISFQRPLAIIDFLWESRGTKCGSP